MAGARTSMETLSKKDAGNDVKLNVILGRENTKRQALETAVRDTNQYGAFQELGGQFFETTFNKKAQMCNFPVTLVEYEGKIPKLGDKEPQDVPEDTYMFFEDQAEWNKKYLTHNYTEPDKKRGTIVASNADSYTNTVYFTCLPNVVLKSTKYRDMYLQKHSNNYPDLNAS